MSTRDLFSEEVKRNWVWIVCIIFGLGGCVYALGVQVIDIRKNEGGIEVNKSRIEALEKNEIKLTSADEKAIMKLDSISCDLKDLKTTIQLLDSKMNERMSKMNERNDLRFDELKKILYKPVVGGVSHFDIIEMSSGEIVKK